MRLQQSRLHGTHPEARLRPEITHLEALHACFPGGSITGAPKFRAMEMIDELEPISRGPYTRALGYLGDPRDWDTEARVEGGFLHFLAEGAAISVTGFYARRFGLHNEWWVDAEDRDRLGMSVGLSVFF